MKTFKEQVEEIYAKKRANGLVDVHFTVKKPVTDPEAFYEEIVRLEEAIAAGRVRPLSFGDLSLKLSTDVVNRREQIC